MTLSFQFTTYSQVLSLYSNDPIVKVFMIFDIFLTNTLDFLNIFYIFCIILFHFFEINGIICTANRIFAIRIRLNKSVS